MLNKKTKRQGGFTLVELAIVLIMFGFVSSAILLALKTYTQQVRVQNTRDAVNNSIAAIELFINENNGRYPCPSDPTLAIGNLAYGHDMIEGFLDTANAATNAANITAILDRAGPAPPPVTYGAQDGNGNMVSTDDAYVVGGIPYNTLKNTDGTTGVRAFNAAGVDIEFSADDATDGWNNQLTYAVSRHLCDPTDPNYGQTFGNLDVIIEELDGTDEISLLPEGQFAQFVVLSHGENGRGAYNTQGNEVINCVNTITPPPPGPLPTTIFPSGFASEVNNCNYPNNNGLFLSGVRNESDNNNYFDDYIKFSYQDNYRIWSSRPALLVPDDTTPDPTDFIEISRINNVNDGGIAINTDTADEAVHVQGDILATEIQAEQFCDTTTQENCIAAETLAGNDPNMNCAGSGAVKSISNSSVICENPFAGKAFTCGLDGSGNQQYLNAVRSDGTFDCVTP